MKIVEVNLPIRCDCGLCRGRAVYAAQFDGTTKDRRINMCARCAEDMFFLLGETLGVIDCIGGSGRADGQTCGDSGKANAIAGDSECRDADTCACGSRGKTCNTCDKTCNTCDKTCGTCDKTCDTCGDVCGGGACGGKDKDCSCNIGCAHTVASNSDAALQERTDSDRRRQ